jgi:hypothetical protein
MPLSLLHAARVAAAVTAALAAPAAQALKEVPFDVTGFLGAGGALQFALPLYEPSSPSSFLAGVRIELDLSGRFNYAQGAVTSPLFGLNRTFDSNLTASAAFPGAQFGIGGITYTGFGAFQSARGTTTARFSADPALAAGTATFSTRYASSVAEPYRTGLPYSAATGSIVSANQVVPVPHWAAGDGRTQMQMTVTASELASLGIGVRPQDVQLRATGRVLFDEGQLRMTRSVIRGNPIGGADIVRFQLSAEAGGQAVPLPQAAAAMGVHHFNFLQHVVTAETPMIDYRGETVPFGAGAYDGPAGGPFNLAVKYAAALRGVPEPATLAEQIALVRSVGSPEVADRLPYYLDERMASWASFLRPGDPTVQAIFSRLGVPGWKYHLTDRVFDDAADYSISAMGIIDPLGQVDPRAPSKAMFMTDVPNVEALFTTAAVGVRTDCTGVVVCDSPFITMGDLIDVWQTQRIPVLGGIRVSSFAQTPAASGGVAGESLQLRRLSLDEWFAMTGQTPDTLAALGGSVRLATPVPEPASAAMLLLGLAGLAAARRRRASRLYFGGAESVKLGRCASFSASRVRFG